MGTPAYEEELYLFFEEYADFMARMAQAEEEKLHALVSNDLPRIEHAISEAQANIMQLENYEQRRQRMQERAGTAGMSFSEIIARASDAEHSRLESLFSRIQASIDIIKFHNGKSMTVARANIQHINPEAVLPKSEGAPTNAYIRAKEEEAAARTSVLQTKI